MAEASRGEGGVEGAKKTGEGGAPDAWGGGRGEGAAHTHANLLCGKRRGAGGGVERAGEEEKRE